ncbi:MAG: hypothetical protein V1888_02010 [archaeon]
MGLFSKSEEIPIIPKASSLPELPKSEESVKRDLPGLPSFPVNSKNKKLNQEMVKSAVTDMPSPGENEMSVEIPQGIHVRELDDEEEIISQTSSLRSPTSEYSTLPPIPTLPERAPVPPVSKISMPTFNEPIFVRIDKFQAAQKNFMQIKDKLEKIETVLKKIEEVRAREEVELKGWAEDITKIKLQITEVDMEIFDQI